eukprot:NODE_1004_length_2656_cov_7.775405.p1 GENE.NODE_1004_length_2656_cov_7.775405~~NODE_1004_length_2656_cov_7.775405.p1  ORF type:complete len:844 (-),score=168.29 NODE_1004_length_2656_cov_7.775405:123-2372(-)
MAVLCLLLLAASSGGRTAQHAGVGWLGALRALCLGGSLVHAVLAVRLSQELVLHAEARASNSLAVRVRRAVRLLHGGAGMEERRGPAAVGEEGEDESCCDVSPRRAGISPAHQLPQWEHLACYANASLSFGTFQILQVLCYTGFADLSRLCGGPWLVALRGCVFVGLSLPLIALDLDLELSCVGQRTSAPDAPALAGRLAALGLLMGGPLLAVTILGIFGDGVGSWLLAPLVFLLHAAQHAFFIQQLAPLSDFGLPLKLRTARALVSTGWLRPDVPHDTPAGVMREAGGACGRPERGALGALGWTGEAEREAWIEEWLVHFECDAVQGEHLRTEQRRHVQRIREAFDRARSGGYGVPVVPTTSPVGFAQSCTPRIGRARFAAEVPQRELWKAPAQCYMTPMPKSMDACEDDSKVRRRATTCIKPAEDLVQPRRTHFSTPDTAAAYQRSMSKFLQVDAESPTTAECFDIGESCNNAGTPSSSLPDRALMKGGAAEPMHYDLSSPQDTAWVSLYYWGARGVPVAYWVEAASGEVRWDPPPPRAGRPAPDLLGLTDATAACVARRGGTAAAADLVTAGARQQQQQQQQQQQRTSRARTTPLEPDARTPAYCAFLRASLCPLILWLAGAVLVPFLGDGRGASPPPTHAASSSSSSRPNAAANAQLLEQLLPPLFEDLLQRSADQPIEVVARRLALHCPGLVARRSPAEAASNDVKVLLSARLRSEADLGDGILSADELRLWLHGSGALDCSIG